MTGFELIEDIEKERRLIEGIIKRHGNDAEQNYGYFLAHQNKDDKCIFIRNGNQGILTTYSKATNYWVMIGTPITAVLKQANFLYDAMNYLKRMRMVSKFVAEFSSEGKKQVEAVFNGSYVVHQPSCILHWPVYEMESWDGDKLEGASWKKLRNLINRISKLNDINIVDSKKVEKEELKNVIKKWAKFRNLTGKAIDRKDSNRTDYDQYLNLVDLGFAGCKFAKSVMINGRAVSITAGWDIPNSETSYYSGIGIYDYNLTGLGEYVNWSDLCLLKKEGYKEVNFGGSPKPLLQFKQKFKPSRTYKTKIFTISLK